MPRVASKEKTSRESLFSRGIDFLSMNGMMTASNSSPLDLCIVIIVTASRSIEFSTG